MTIEQNILQILTQCKAEIQANMASKGINASGRTSAAFKVEQTADGIALVLDRSGRVAPLETLEIGRPAGNVPGGFTQRLAKTGAYAGKPDVSNTFKAILIKWAAEKGYADFGWAAATGLGRKIAYDGTNRNKQHEDVYSTPVQKARQLLASDIRTIILTRIQQANANF